jgi:hypothetical protein
LLEKHGLDESAFNANLKGTCTLQDKDKDKDKDKAKDKDKEQDKEKKPRKPDPVWDAVCEVFTFNPQTQAEKKRVGKLVRDFKIKLADFPDKVYTLTRLIKEHKKKWKDIVPTADSVLKHLDTLGPRNLPVGKPVAPTSSAKPMPKMTEADRAEANRVRDETRSKLFPASADERTTDERCN